MSDISATHNQFAYSVSEISTALKRVVEDNFGQVRVRGEISGWRGPHGSGHAYFRLKDDKSVLEAVCWRGSMGKMAFKLEEGLEVIATGRVTTYPGSSKYQIVIENMEPAGVGALMSLLEKRKAMLATEGLFDEKHKRPLPFMPRTIGVITSPTGAVIRDILHRLSDRFPCHVLVWPVAVQGEAAAEQVAAAIRGFNAMASKPDLLIVARGGGSLEDLWAFNEEVIIRAVAASTIPLISAVGHETDTTLIDYVSDRRAPTPTAAAEMAVPVLADWMLTIMEHGNRLFAATHRHLEQKRELVLGFARGLPHPRRWMEVAAQRLDDWSERLHASLPSMVHEKQQRLAVAYAKLQPGQLTRQISRHLDENTKQGERLQRLAGRMLHDKAQKLTSVAQLLDSLSPQRVLERGFVMVKDGAGRLITRASLIDSPAPLTLTFHDGTRIVTPQ